MNENDEHPELRAKLAELTQEHRDLDAAITALIASGANDQIQLTRLKKRKLQLKDQIATIEDQLPRCRTNGPTSCLTDSKLKSSTTPMTGVPVPPFVIF